MTEHTFKYIPTGSPRFAQVINQIDVIDELFLKDTCDYGLKMKLEREIRFRPIHLLQKESRIPHFPIYRVRRSVSVNEDIGTISPFSIPADSIVTRGRANAHNRAVFYASNNIGTAILESRCSLHEDIYLSVWHFEHPFSYMDYLSTDNLHNTLYSNMYNKRIDLLRKKFSCYTQEETEGLMKSIEKQSRWFLREEDYSISSYISNSHLYETNLDQYGYRIDGILYPSIATNKQSVNFAISRVYAENSLRCSKLFHLRIKEINAEKATIDSLIKVGVCEGKKVIWRDWEEHDLKAFKS